MKPALSRTQAILLYVAGWLPAYALYVVVMWQSARHLPTALLWTFSYLGPAILIGGLVWRIAARVPWTRRSWRAGVLTELALNAGFLVAWHAIFLAFLWLRTGWATTRGIIEQTLVWQLLMGALLCGLHAAVFHAVRIVRELRAKELAAAEAETARVRAEMLVLRGQLDPHFLFNSLHSITALVREDPRRAEEALLQFSALLRRVLAVKRDSADEVTLADEMKFVDDFLAIERLRLGERLHVTCDIAPEARPCRLPAFSVQPLVENALHHAVAPRRDGGRVTIRARVRDGRLEILVRDDGPGSDPRTVEGAGGVGLSAIRQRLQLRHGGRAALDIDTAPGAGFGVTLSLPAETEGGVA
jgi:hypothetical protein